MGAWMIAVKRLSDASRPLSMMDIGVSPKGVERARQLGMLDRLGGKRNATYVLSERGRHFIDNGGRYASTCRARLVACASIGDDQIADMLLSAGHSPGEPITADVLRRYTAAIANGLLTGKFGER